MGNLTIKNYTIIGPLPPPLGGISVYIRRHVSILTREGYSVTVFDFKKSNTIQKAVFCLKILFDPLPRIFHLHAPYTWAMMLLLARPFPKILIFHDHRWEDILKSFGFFRKRLFQAFLNRCSKLILVGEHVRKIYEKYKYITPEDTTIEYPFLPPAASDEKNIVASYSAETRKFIEFHSPLLIANAFRFRVDGADLYGIDLCLETTHLLLSNYANIGLLLALSDTEPGSPDHSALLASIARHDLESKVHVMISKSEIWPLFKKADLMLRPTLKDGASVSIAEALYFHCPVLASDVCERGENVVTFKSKDVNDLVSKAIAILEGKPQRVAY